MKGIKNARSKIKAAESRFYGDDDDDDDDDDGSTVFDFSKKGMLNPTPHGGNKRTKNTKKRRSVRVKKSPKKMTKKRRKVRKGKKM